MCLFINDCSETISIGDTSKGKIISVYLDKDKDPAQTWGGADTQQQSAKLQNDVTVQLLEQQQIITLLTGLVHQQKVLVVDTHQKQLAPINKSTPVLHSECTQQPQSQQ